MVARFILPSRRDMLAIFPLFIMNSIPGSSPSVPCHAVSRQESLWLQFHPRFPFHSDLFCPPPESRIMSKQELVVLPLSSRPYDPFFDFRGGSLQESSASPNSLPHRPKIDALQAAFSWGLHTTAPPPPSSWNMIASPSMRFSFPAFSLS